MDVSNALLAAPWIKRAWKLVPGPLRLPLVLLALVVFVVRALRDDEDDASADSATV